MTPTIRTAAGRYFDFERPHLCQIGVQEIAHALSHICRFTGHTRTFYSVAQHSVLVSYIVPPEDALAGLLHDAAEAFVGDVAKPLKRLLPDYKVIEERVEAAVFTSFGLPSRLPDTVKAADLVALATEKRDLMGVHGDDDQWAGLPAPLARRITPMTAKQSRAAFLRRYAELSRRANPA